MNLSYLYLGTIAKTGDWDSIDISKISKNTVNKVFYGLLDNKTNLIGLAAKHSNLSKFPKELLNEEGLSSSNSDGKSALHLICENNQLKFIPNKFLNETNLNLPDNLGTTPMHVLSLLGYLSQLPNNLITDKLLSNQNKNGHNCLDFCIFALEDLSATGNPEKNQTSLKTQLNLVLSKLKTITLKKELPLHSPKEISFCYKEKTKLIKKELSHRTILEHLKKEDKSIVI